MKKNEIKGAGTFNIEHFTKSYTSVEGKTILWRLFKSAIINKEKSLDTDELKEFAVFYEKMNKLMDDVYANYPQEVT